LSTVNMTMTRKLTIYSGASVLMMVALFLFASDAFGQQRNASPQHWDHRVRDNAEVLSHETLAELEAMLNAHEDSTSNQIAILIIKSLEGKVLEQYALQVAHDELQLGSKKNDNGVLLLIAIDDHKMRIEVGKGLEGALTDALCSRIIRNEIAPAFRQDNYDEGVMAGTRAIIKAIKGEYTAEAGDIDTAHELDMTERIVIGIFLFIVLGIFTTMALLIPGKVGWFLYAFLILFYATFPLIVLGGIGGMILLTIYLIGFPIAKLSVAKTNWGKRMASKAASANGGGGWSSGSGWTSGSSWSSGSSSGGGGFSGGGGSFGGGGSSGSW
jgi:uncharacterized protein